MSDLAYIDDNLLKQRIYINGNSGFVLDNVYYYLSDEEIAKNNALADDDKDKLPNIYTDIKLSVCDNFAVKIADIFDDISLD